MMWGLFPDRLSYVIDRHSQEYDQDHTADQAALAFEHTDTEALFFQAVEIVEED
jgi:hypothetical protein